MNSETNVQSFLNEIIKYGAQKTIRITHKKELKNDLNRYLKEDTKFTIFNGLNDFDIIVRFNSKVYWYVENTEKIRYGVLLSFNSFDIPCHKVRLVLVSVINKIEVDLFTDVFKREYILTTFNDVYSKLVFIHEKLQQYLIKKHELVFTSNRLYKNVGDNKLKPIQLIKMDKN